MFFCIDDPPTIMLLITAQWARYCRRKRPLHNIGSSCLSGERPVTARDQAQFLTTWLASLPPTSISISFSTRGFYSQSGGSCVDNKPRQNKGTQSIWEAIKDLKCAPKITHTHTHQWRMVLWLFSWNYFTSIHSKSQQKWPEKGVTESRFGIVKELKAEINAIEIK